MVKALRKLKSKRIALPGKKKKHKTRNKNLRKINFPKINSGASMCCSVAVVSVKNLVKLHDFMHSQTILLWFNKQYHSRMQ